MTKYTKQKIGLCLVLIGYTGLVSLFTLFASGRYSCSWEHWPFIVLLILGTKMVILLAK